MNVSARVRNRFGEHDVTVSTDDRTQAVAIPHRSPGPGSGVSGGELLFLALATCYCNDLYREAAKRGIEVREVEVDVQGEFGAEGEPPTNVRYHVRVVADAPEREIRSLMIHTDTVAEVQNTMRDRVSVRLGHTEAVQV